MQDLGHDARRPENIQQILLFQIIREHQFVQDIHRTSRLERVVLLFKILDEQRQEFRHATLGSSHLITFAVQLLQQSEVTLVLRLAANNSRQSAGKESGILRSDGSRAHNFQAPLSYSACVKTWRM